MPDRRFSSRTGLASSLARRLLSAFGTMLKITRTDEDEDRTTLRLEGRLGGEALLEFDATWRACVAERRHVVLDLAGVRFVDAAGAALLRALRETSVQITGCSAFVQELLKEGP
jgi:ABC-type transporter Mla MlaB component